MKKKKKIQHKRIDQYFLKSRAERSMRAGYKKQRWILFSEYMLRQGFQVELYEAQRTVSKYVTVIGDNGKRFKVRFSDHKPIKHREIAGDCDFFVGRTNLGVTTTGLAIVTTMNYFKEKQDEHSRVHEYTASA